MTTIYFIRHAQPARTTDMKSDRDFPLTEKGRRDRTMVMKGKNLAVATHGTALSTIINYFDSSYGYEEFIAMVYKMPWAVKMIFDGQEFLLIETVDLY